MPVKALPSLFMMVPEATTAPAGELSGIVTEGGQPVKTGACCAAGGEIVKAIWIEVELAIGCRRQPSRFRCRVIG